MTDSDGSKSAMEAVKPQIKRKRKEVIDTSDEDGKSKTKKQRRLSSSSESLNDEDVSNEKSDEETEKLETPKTNEEKSDDEKVKKSPESGDEDESGNDDESKTGDKEKSDESSDDEKEEKEEDSDSSSLPSLDDDKEVEAAKKVAQMKSKGKEGKSDMKNKEGKSASDTSSASQSDDENDGKSKKKQGAKKKSEKAEKAKGSKVSFREAGKSSVVNTVRLTQEDNKSVVRLKRYIALCGVRRNYKKILGDCRSVQAMVAVLKKELEDLGVKGQPSIQKCKKARMKREEARELAELNMDNIIYSEGRTSRRGTASGRKQEDSRSSMYKHAVNSSSGSDQENKGNGGRRRIDWSNLQGIISDDGDSA
ncbi:HIRA-interacting protein 3 isoform X2 [Synchiropus splendidus]|uniref:HIRA-interacting protein 3 isoform X2 n=1 Tax=Synchiropus splendidus TaxID=270530 RepID=UPI00237D8128|nr:HIRA-interacting protein 3 isoform X2 [Synchiropus splendidus]